MCGRTTGEGISRPIIRALAVDNPVLQPNEFGEDFLLPRCVKPLIGQLYQTAMIGDDLKLGMLQITALVL